MPIRAARLHISDYNEARKNSNADKSHKVRQITLSLTSMVDMFAILVIFLLAQSDSSQWLTLSHDINLPQAGYYDAPPRGITLMVAKNAVYNENTEIVSIAAVNAAAESVEPIVRFLDEQRLAAEKAADEAGDEKAANPATFVNIVADESLPFGAIRRIVTSCQVAGFATVNLATQPKS